MRRNRASNAWRGISRVAIGIAIILGTGAKAVGGPGDRNVALISELPAGVAYQAERVGARAARAAAQVDAFRSDLDRECENGKLDACFAAAELRSVSMVPRWSDSPARGHAQVTERAQYLQRLCRKGNPASCYRLGMFVFMFAGSVETWPLYRKGGLREMVVATLATAALPTPDRERLSATLADLLETDSRPRPEVMKQWFRACTAGKAYACFSGGAFQWRPTVGESLTMFAAIERTLHDRVLGDLFQRSCSKYPDICARGLYHANASKKISDDQYGVELARLCGNADPDACYRLGIRMGYAKDRAGESAHYEKACDLGSPDGCAAMIDRVVNMGDTVRALSLAVQACQATDPSHCWQLVVKFGSSRDFTTREMGRSLLKRACDKGYQQGCYTVYEYAFQDGDWETARREFGRLCEVEQNVAACRYAAQVAWSRKQFDSATQLLDKGCADRDINSCIELAGLRAERGDAREADRLLGEWCERSLGPHPCELRRLLRTGFRPTHLNEIFQQPLDGSEYIDVKAKTTQP